MKGYQVRDLGAGKLSPLRPQTTKIQTQLEDWTQSGRKQWDLFRHLCNPYLLADATKLVLANKGSAGVDEVTCEQVRGMGWSFIKRLIEKLKTRTYHPKAVRRVYIPKRDGRKRPLGIPALEDRVIQRALVLLMEPIYEQIFLPCSYGFRPGKRAVECVAKVSKSVYKNRYVIDADIKGFFDNVSHKKLMGMLKEKIVDPRVLNLIEEILKSGYMEEGKGWQATNEGTPQGGPLSPLLANIYLHYILDSRFEQIRKDCPRIDLFRYADDFIVACKSKSDLQFIGGLIRGWLREGNLELHPEKTRGIDMSNGKRTHRTKFDFLGYKFHLRSFKDSPWRYWVARQPSEKARKSLHESLKTRLTPNLSTKEAKRKVREIWYGWCHYFKYGNSNRVFYRECNTVNLRVTTYLRKKYRHQRKPVPWGKLHWLRKEICKEIKPIRVRPEAYVSALPMGA